jgi:hypothetical protein
MLLDDPDINDYSPKEKRYIIQAFHNIQWYED